MTEFKCLTGQEHHKTSIVFEHPRAVGDPYYPIPQPQNAELYAKYKAMAEALPNVHFAGRLGTYKYYNMDQVVAQALTLAEKIGGYRNDAFPSGDHADQGKRVAGVKEKMIQGQISNGAA